MTFASVPSFAAVVETAMRAIRRTLVAVVASFAALFGPGAAAQNCANFGDVLASSLFCPSVEWMKNRAITTGCGNGSIYCPNDPVTRLSMAAFMKRLGDALTPVDLAPVSAAGSVVTPNANPVLCPTPDFAVTGFPRRAYVNAAAILSAPSAGIDVSATVVFSTNAGASWTAVNNADQYGTLYSGATPADRITLSPFGSVDLNVNQNVRFGVRLGQFAGSGTPTLTAACLNRVQIANRTGTSTPLDVQTTAARQRSD